MLAPYVSLFRRPGTLRFSAAGFVQRLPMSMLGLGVVLFLTLRGEPYALAGAVSAAGALATAAFGPFLSRYIDRYTQHRVLPAAVSFSVVMQVVFVVVVLVDAPVWTWFLFFALGEAFVPNVGSLIRARWAHVLPEAGEVRTAFALESVLDEIVFVTGPPLATALALGLVSWGAIGASILMLVIGTVLLVPQRATEPPAAGPEHREGRAALLHPGVPLLFAVLLLVGGIFGSYEVTVVAFAAEQDARGLTGVLLAVYALGSAAGGLVLGARHLAAPLPVQLRAFTLALAVVTIPAPFVGSVWVLGLLSLVAGLAVAPTLITSFALVERLVPPQRLTEGLTVLMAGLTVGFAFATPTAGALIDARGASTAFALTTVCAILAAVVCLVGTPYLSRSLAAAEARDTATS